MAVSSPKAIFFLPWVLELFQKYEIVNTTAMKTAIGRINFIMILKIIRIDI